MTRPFRTLASAAAVGLLAIITPASADDRGDVERLLNTYETELNAGNTSGIVPLYAADGVFMAQHSLPQSGRPAIEAAYAA